MKLAAPGVANFVIFEPFMQYIWQHITQIIGEYKGGTPLALFLKSYCKRFPKLGSRDRRVLSDMAYCWYRCSKGLKMDDADVKEQITACLQLCGAQKTLAILQLPDSAAQINFDDSLLVPASIALSDGITEQQWLAGMLTLPDLFLRVRKKRKEMLAILQAADIQVREIGDSCIAVPNSTKADQLLPPEAYVVQDASSQAAGNYFKPRPGDYWWDCCAGAGGKSIQLLDMEPGVHLTVSDIRPAILHNHRERCQLYGHTGINFKTIDMSVEAEIATQMKGRRFNNIICDVPCSGSGTFARIPEQLFFLDQEEQAGFPALQATIATNAAAFLQPGGTLYYITCSVFRNENEDVVQEVVSRTGLTLKKQLLINGLAKKADSLFVAILVKE
jgi:16S rRNA (cytosine967-C5)-methyltransferase